MALEGTGAEAGKGQEASLPQLKLKEVARSKEPLKLVEESSPSRNQIKTCPYKDYTMVIIKGSPNMLAFENSGQEIVSFGKNIGILIPRIRGELISIMEKMELKDVSLMIGEQFLAIAVPKKIPRHDPYLSKAFLTQANDVNLPPTRWEDFTPESYGGEEGSLERWLGKFLQEQYGAVKEIGIKPHSYYASTSPKSFFIVNANGKTMLEDKVEEVGDNFIVDPTNCDVVYYLEGGNNPVNLIKLDTGKDPKLWQTEKANLPKRYGRLYGLDLDPSGKFFLLETEKGIVFLRKDTLEEIGNLEDVFGAHFDPQGRIRAVAKTGHFVIYEPNFAEFVSVIERKRIADLAKGIKPEDLFRKEGGTEPVAVEASTAERLAPLKKQFIPIFAQKIQSSASFEDLGDVSRGLNNLKLQLKAQGLKAEEVEFVTSDIVVSIGEKQKKLAMPLVAQGLTDLGAKLSTSLTVALLSEARGDIVKLKSLEGFVDNATRTQIRVLENQFRQQSDEFYRKESPMLEKYGANIVNREIERLGQITSRPDFEDWREHTLPGQLKRIGALIDDYPPDALPETLEKLMALAKQLRDVSKQYEIKFKEQYAEVRQKASVIMGERIGLMKADVDSFVERLRKKGFKDRSQAEVYVSSSEALGILRSEIAELAMKDPDAAQKLDKTLKVQIANIMFEIERGGATKIAETGQQMELFGKTLFPRWEGKVPEKSARQVDIIFIPDEKSKGPGVTADKVLGDIGIIEINSRGKVEKRRLYEGLRNEDAWKYGSVSSRGRDIFPSYVTNAEFRQIKKDYAEWNGGKLEQQFSERRKALVDLYATRQKFKQRTPEIDNPWKEKYKSLLDEYTKFAQEHRVLLLSRIDQVKNAPETAFANGKGAVEEWQNYWVRDGATERYLDEMAQILKMQLEQQSGILTIRGNPGAGKDVLVSMFSNRTNRPYFATDCSKWDTPYEFSEDIVLESVDGASQTVHVPSTVLNGITTPGAIVYFNEIHALTEPAQIFLHALTDAKRRITLKTSSGKVIKVLDNVVLMASMNPQAKDPIEPALRDRMVFMDVDYPPLYRKKDPADPNPNSPIDASEALRIAREVKSLSDLTIEQNIDRNEFVRVWDKYINGIDNGAGSPSKTQEFDINVILAIVQFTNKLRENFVAFKSGRSQIASKALPVSLPATGRPLRDCAYALSSIPDGQKIAGNPEAVARTLLERWFLSKIDSVEDREKIKTAMATWTSSKRVGL